MGRTAASILGNWDHERDNVWYAVDELTMGTSEWTGAKNANAVRRLYVGDADGAYEFARRLIAGESEDTRVDAPFFRVTCIPPESAHDWFLGCEIGEGSDELMTVSEAARAYGLSRQSVHERIRRGRIPAELIGGTWYVMDVSMATWKPIR